MSRWSAAYRHSFHTDTVDTLDTVGAAGTAPGHCVNRVNSVNHKEKAGYGVSPAPVTCSRCGTETRFHAVQNLDGWLCAACWPADPNDAAYRSEERAAIRAEGEHGNAIARVPHPMPTSWADPTIVPIAGAFCRNCNARTWWTEAVNPRGWRCSRCHPGDHLPRDKIRSITT